jgi:hypothetical protein
VKSRIGRALDVVLRHAGWIGRGDVDEAWRCRAAGRTGCGRRRGLSDRSSRSRTAAVPPALAVRTDGRDLARVLGAVGQAFDRRLRLGGRAVRGVDVVATSSRPAPGLVRDDGRRWRRWRRPGEIDLPVTGGRPDPADEARVPAAGSERGSVRR